MDKLVQLLGIALVSATDALTPPTSVRLEAGYVEDLETAGRVSVCHEGTWGTVCDDHFDAPDAGVLCKMMGYYGLGFDRNSTYGKGTGPIWLENLACEGTEMTIDQCTHGRWGEHNCAHQQDVSIECHRGVRLVNGPDSQSGRLEVYHDGEWGTVCDDVFTDKNAAVFCNMLGYRGPASSLSNKYGMGTGRIWLDNVACVGNESYVEQCEKNDWGTNNCDHDEDISIQCSNEPVFSGCSQLSDQFTAICGTMPCNELIDDDVTSCVSVPHDKYPWRLHAVAGIIDRVWSYCWPTVIYFDVRGKGFDCNDGQLRFGFNGDHNDTRITSGKFTYCHMVSDLSDDVTHLITCRFACEATAELSPKMVLIHAEGPGLEICALTLADYPVVNHLSAVIQSGYTKALTDPPK